MNTYAQHKLSVIRATSRRVAINDGGYLDRNAWSLSPGIKPDVYTADRTRETKWVTFYTDIDSIKVKVKPGSKFNFVVLLNGKDSCYTQIASAIPANAHSPTNKIDTIPFTLTAYNAIAVKAVLNKTDTLKLHFDLSSFDFHLTKDAILNKTHLLANTSAPDYRRLNATKTLQMGTMVLNDAPVLSTNITAKEMDGRFGWNVFEGKQIALDYDKGLIIVRSKPAKVGREYGRSKLCFVRSFPYATGFIVIGGKRITGNFAMDTGSEQAVILDSSWAATQKQMVSLKVIKSSYISDPRGVKYEIKVVSVPQLMLNGLSLTNVPTLILNRQNPLGIEINYLGNDVLKRFNIIIDFKNDYLYLKPNKYMSEKYYTNS
ncbi:hypothetical protein FPZ43_02375 [Mucilaginibacter pallidiroseus]|uniref:Aspartyl protease n=1 Tax=Mucilaginibacter pallidiroseus TaxID=2599295 RepID=A0A563UIZ0_9SPHI|nr:hypothetical protein [Mucilaginibacter pallidiroseus]TWR31342.1 hypothetical protein FPZ43_02375 [Mucilaginibacter pallidiroseus]